MPGAAVRQLPALRVEDAAEHRGAGRPGQHQGEPVQGGEHLGRAGRLQQQRPAGTAQLPHHRGCGQAPADAVTDDDADPAVGQGHRVVPVAADLQGAGRRLVPYGEAVGQLGRAEDGPLQRDRHLTLLVGGVRPVQRLPECAAQEQQQHLVLGAETPRRVEFEPDHQRTLRRVDSGAGAGRPDTGGRVDGDPQGWLRPQRGDGVADRPGELRPVGDRRAGQRRYAVRLPVGGEHPVRLPQLAQLLHPGAQRLGGAGGPGQPLVEGAEGGLPLHRVPLGGDVADGADHHPPAVVVGDRVEGDRRPEPVAVAVPQRHHERAVGHRHDLRESVGHQPVRRRVGGGVGPPRILGHGRACPPGRSRTGRRRRCSSPPARRRRRGRRSPPATS